MRSSAFILFGTFLLWTCLGLGCSSKKDLDAKVDSLIDVFQEGDWEEMQSISHSAVLSDIDEDRFNTIASAVQKMGDFEDRTMRGIEVNNDRKEGLYELEFENGAVDLELVVIDGKIAGFEFMGSAFEDALAEANGERFAEFKVYEFVLLDKDGNPNPGGSHYSRPGKVSFRLAIQGLGVREGNYHCKVALVVKDGGGAILREIPDFIDQKIAVDGPPIISVDGFVELGGGTYTLAFHVTDGINEKSLDYSSSVTVADG